MTTEFLDEFFSFLFCKSKLYGLKRWDCENIQLYKCTNVQMYIYTNVQMYIYTNVQMYIFVLVLKGENMGNDEGEETC